LARRVIRKRACCCCGCPTLILLGLAAVVIVVRRVPSWPAAGVTKVASSEGCKRPDWSPDGKRIVFDRWPSGGVGYVDLDDGEVHEVTDQGFEPAWFADGRRILVMRAARSGPGVTATSPAIYTADGEQVRAFDDTVVTFWHGHLDPKSERIYGVTAPTSRIGGPNGAVVVGLGVDDGEPEVITSEDVSHPSRGVRWSPDGRWSAYRTLAYRGAWYHHAIWIANPDGTGARQLPGPKALLSDPGWSPDGKWIAVIAVRPSSGRRIADWAGGRSGGSRSGRLVADGIKKAVGEAPATLGELWLLRSDGSKSRRILCMGATRDAYSAALATNPPAFSPDGKRIAFVKDGAIWLVDLPGGD
jgi:Tol biopolymer transport system component